MNWREKGNNVFYRHRMVQDINGCLKSRILNIMYLSLDCKLYLC